MKRTIIVDIDNTLWDFAPVLWDHLRREDPSIPPPTEWHRWDFWRERIGVKEFYRVLREIHLRQDTFAPFPDARAFLESLKGKGWTVIIASHREKETCEATERWLRLHELPFDELHLSNDKSVLFPGSWALVDDSPVTLDKARQAGMVRAGLLYPWNAGSGHPLFPTLGMILAYLEGELEREG
jgi:hypothetical protein